MNEILIPPCNLSEIINYNFKFNFEGLTKYLDYLNTTCIKAFEQLNQVKLKFGEIDELKQNFQEVNLKLISFDQRFYQIENTINYNQIKLLEIEKQTDSHENV